MLTLFGGDTTGESFWEYFRQKRKILIIRASGLMLHDKAKTINGENAKGNLAHVAYKK